MARGDEVTLAWPAMVVPDDEGWVQVRFPAFPETPTGRADATHEGS
jgi:hypothetical protein